MAEHDDILRKIQKALALANDKRGDANTAAIALRQAQKLMEAYNISHTTILASQIGESDLRSKVAVVNPSSWEGNAMSFCAAAFGCRLMWTRGGPEPTNKGYWSIFGPKMQVDVCVYASVVMTRALLKARTEFVKNLTADPILGDLERKKKSKMVDDFCMGWGYAIREKLTALADPDGLVKQANDAYLKVKYGNAKKAETRGEHDERSLHLMRMGARAAENFSIHRPMDQQSGSQPLKLGR